MSLRHQGTEGYAEQAESLIEAYDGIAFEDVHRPVLHLLPEPPARVLDVGAGTGRDAAALAARGHRVVAVEPTALFREAAQMRHPSDRITWVDDGLPALASLEDRTGGFDLILLSAVWMHLDLPARKQAMARLSAMLAPDGVMILSLRHGPVPAGRRMFPVGADETAALATAHGLREVARQEKRDSTFKRPDVHWTLLAFRAGPAPDEGSRHV